MFEPQADIQMAKGLPTEMRTFGGRILLDSAFECGTPGGGREHLYVEVQKSPYTEYDLGKRQEFYAHVLMALQQGRTFKGDDYSGLVRADFLWIIVCPRARDRGKKTVYWDAARCMQDGREDVVSSGMRARITVVNLCHPDKAKDGLTRLLSVLFFPELTLEERERRLREDYNIVIDEFMRECLRRVGIMGYREELIEGMVATARAEGLEEGMERGMEKGLEKGIEKGIEKGMEKGRSEERARTVSRYVQTVAGMLSKGLTSEEAMSLVPEDIAEDVRKAMAASAVRGESPSSDRGPPYHPHAFSGEPLRFSARRADFDS